MGAETPYSYEEKLHHYSESAPEYKVKYILANYDRFPRIVAGYESNWEVIIRAERRYSQVAEKGVLGVRVQTSEISDPTMTDAISNLEINAAHTKKELFHVLKGTDNPDQHIMAKCIIQDMQDDYEILRNMICMLGQADEEMLLRYLQREDDSLQNLADECGLELATYKKRIYNLKKSVSFSAVECIEVKYGLVQRERYDVE